MDHFFQIIPRRFYGIISDQPQVHSDGSFRRDHVECLSALHFCDRTGCTEHRVQFSARFFADFIEQALKTPEICKQDLIQECRVPPQCVQHLPHRFCHLSWERMLLHIGHSLRQFSHDRMYRRHRRMSAAALCVKFNIGQTFFRNTDQRAFPIHAREYIVHNGSALVDDHCRMDPFFFKPVHDRRTALAVDFFLTGKCKVNIMLRYEALRDQFLCRFHDSAQRSFRVQRSSSPKHAVFHDPVKCRFLPLAFFHRNNIVMRHQHDRISLVFSSPAIQNPVHTMKGAFTRLMDFRIHLRKQFSEL